MRSNAVMGTSGMTPPITDTTMADNRNLLPNLNCLGVWQVAESAIYDRTVSTVEGMRRQLLRIPDVDPWNTLAVQSVVYYPTADAAGDFFDAVGGPLVEMRQPSRQHHAQRSAAAQVVEW